MLLAKYPYTAKSNHSSTLPISPASAVRSGDCAVVEALAIQSPNKACSVLQRASLGLDDERQQQQAGSGNEPDIEQRLNRRAGALGRNAADDERSGGGDDAADVVREARACSAQPCWEQFRQVVGETAEHAEH